MADDVLADKVKMYAERCAKLRNERDELRYALEEVKRRAPPGGFVHEYVSAVLAKTFDI